MKRIIAVVLTALLLLMIPLQACGKEEEKITRPIYDLFINFAATTSLDYDYREVYHRILGDYEVEGAFFTESSTYEDYYNYSELIEIDDLYARIGCMVVNDHDMLAVGFAQEDNPLFSIEECHEIALQMCKISFVHWDEETASMETILLENEYKANCVKNDDVVFIFMYSPRGVS